MPEPEPTTWELMRILREIREDVKNLVTKDAFERESLRIDEKFRAVAEDLAEERAARVAGIAAEKSAREKAEEAAQQKAVRLSNNIRWLAGAVLVPVALYIATLLTR